MVFRIRFLAFVRGPVVLCKIRIRALAGRLFLFLSSCLLRRSGDPMEVVTHGAQPGPVVGHKRPLEAGSSHLGYQSHDDPAPHSGRV